MKAARTAPTRSAQAADAGSGNAAEQVRPTAPMQFAAVPTTEDAFDVADHGEVRATTTQLSSQDRRPQSGSTAPLFGGPQVVHGSAAACG